MCWGNYWVYGVCAGHYLVNPSLMMTLKVLVTRAVIRIGAKSIQDTFSEIFYDLITLSIKENIMKKA